MLMVNKKKQVSLLLQFVLGVSLHWLDYVAADTHWRRPKITSKEAVDKNLKKNMHLDSLNEVAPIRIKCKEKMITGANTLEWFWTLMNVL